MMLIGAAFILLGSIVTALATVGIIKYNDVFLRMHAASKSASFGVVLMLIGAMFAFPQIDTFSKLIFAVLLIFLKTPVASQAIARAAYYLREEKDWGNLVLDEWYLTPAEKQKGKNKNAS